MTKTPNILFVHGAWANASSWNKVLPLIEAAGLTGTAVSLGLATLADDAAILKRAIELIEGPVLLVGHSYGGSVISEAGNDTKVAGLVYLTAFAPGAGESAGSLAASGPPNGLLDVIRPDAYGFLKLTRKGVEDVFAQDLTPAEQALIFATQTPLSAAAFGGNVTAPAWKEKPSWFLLATEDNTIHPELQQTMSAKIGATTRKVATSHLPMLSQPHAVAEMILQAAG